MSDLAEVVEDLICTFDGASDTTMDTLAMFVFGWILAALFILWLSRLIYSRFIAKTNDAKIRNEQQIKIGSENISAATSAVDNKTGLLKKTDSKGITPRSGASSGGLGGGGGGYVPPTPPVRKRLARQSPTPEPRKIKYIPAPQCTGPDNICVLWVNDVFQWLYNDFVIVNELITVWINALNEYSKKTVEDQGVGIELVRILPETNVPSLSNIFAENDSKDDVTITCDCDATPAFQLKSFRQKGDKVETSHYRVNINRFRARLNIFCVSEKLQASIKCDGWPDIKVALAQVGNIKNNLDETHLQEVISEILINALRNTEVNLNLAQYPTCPRLIRHVIQEHHHILPLHYDSMSNAYSSTPNHSTTTNANMGSNLLSSVSDKRLLVKILRATNLGNSCTEPFCVVEIDEPPQKNQTSVQKNTNSPFWDEHFLFDLYPNTAEILFEIYDHAVKPHKFLGLGIVGVEELLINPSQRQIITLQSRPYESDPVSGTLTVEFLFVEGVNIPNIGSNQPYKVKESIRPISPTRPTNVTFLNDSLTNGNHFPQNLSNINRSNQNPIRNNTLVIHSVQRQPSQRLVKTSDLSQTSTLSSSQTTNIATTNLINQENQQQSNENRGRSRKRRDFFGTIKRRLGKSKGGRSKSVGLNDEFGRDDSLNRSVSADRGRNHHEGGYRLNVPGQRSMDETSRRSSLSEASGLSTASGRTYINEASTLVLETLENGIKKHYLVPLSLAQKSKWRKKGAKLHIFNDHTFIAKHLSGVTVCQVCGKNITRRIGKQGYECRDCLLKCHKHCHVKVNDNCPTSTIHNIELSMLPVLSD